MRRIALLILLSFIGGCTTGHDFVSPTAENLVLGRTPRSEILRLYGPPFKETSAVLSTPATLQNRTPFDPASVSGTFVNLVYFYQDRSTAAFAGGPKNKFVFFDFWNDALIAYNFTSNFENDSSNFDESKIAQIHKGTTTENEVTQLLGVPTGRAVYPAVQQPGNQKSIYSYLDIHRGERTVKRLEVLFDKSGTVIDYRFAADTSPLPVQPAPATTFVPIIIPHK
jgi:hypothetical protein